MKQKNKLQIIPLGGLGEIGKNMTVIRYGDDIIIVDTGLMFPDEDMLGIDLVIPDMSYVLENKDLVRAVFLTHGHEDHIGALPYLLKNIDVPVYGTCLTLGILQGRLKENHVTSNKLNEVTTTDKVKAGVFTVSFLRVNHSIADSVALAIETPHGTIVHTGDFKFDQTPVDGKVTEFHRFAELGDKGVLALLADSTNAERPGYTASEKSVGRTLDEIFRNAKNRIVVASFSSNIHRLQQVVDSAVHYGRKLAVIGRSMLNNINIALELGYITIPEGVLIDIDAVNQYTPAQVAILTTGSQGESMSALYRMAIHEHRHVKIKPEDQIILSAKAIPGNEGSVSEIINHLLKAGAKVAYQDFADIHVSGHAAQEEQKLMLRLVKPKFFLPVHGEYNHALKHGETGVDCGVLERNVYVMADGEQIEVNPKYLKKVKTVKSGKVYIDNQLNHKISDDVVIDRQTMAKEGIVMIVAQINENDRTLASKPKVATFGFISDKQDRFFTNEIEEILNTFLVNAKPGIFKNSRILEDELRKVVRKHCVRKYKKYPMIVPTIFVQ